MPTPSVAMTEFTFTLVTIRPLTSADEGAGREHDQDRHGDRQLVVDDEAGDQDAVQTGREADRQVEFTDDDGQRQARRR